MKFLSLFAAAMMLFGVQSANADTTISFTLSEAGVGTLILPYDAALPDGLKAYKCVSLQGTMVVLEEQESITAHAPVLMQGEPGTYIFTGMPAEGDASYTSGLLTGVMEATTITTGYVLATQNGVTGFYKLEPGTTLPANRCYLQVEAAAKMLELLFPEDAFTLTCLSGSNFGGNEGCQNLFDGTQGTKWGTGNGRYDTVYTIFKTALPIAARSYELVIADDTPSMPGRNWKKWSIYAANFASDADATKDAAEWVLIDQKDEELEIGTGNNTYVVNTLTISNPQTTYYSYYKIVVEELVGGWDLYCQMDEFRFKDFTIDKNFHLHAATFTASQIEITPGQTAQLVIGMNNTETNLSGFQFKLYLPEGLSVTTNASGQFVYTQSGRIANHTVNFRALDDGGYLVVVYSMDADVITGSSGELMSISVTADETASTSGNGTLSNIRITDVSSITSSCSDVPIDVTILNVHPHDATFTASQIEITPRQTAQLVIGMNNTDTNLSGFQFKLYLPEGLSVTTNDNGQFVYTQSERIANHTVNIRALDDGGYLVVVYSMDANVITGSSGELMSISVTADETASTSGNGTLSNIRITDVSSSTSSCNDVTIDVTIVPKFHYVTFKYGETVYLHEQVAYGAVVPVPEDPMLKGHTFAGWSPDVPETMPDSDLVFTALFTVNQYTVTFTIPSEEWTKEFTLDYGAAITVPDVPQKPGYTFAGWDKPVPETMPDSAIVFTGSYTQNLQILTLTASGNGSVSYGETNIRSASQNFNVAELSQVILTITPDTGHHIASLLLNGENALSLLTEDGKLTIESMTASVSVSVTFAPNVHDVTFRYGETIYQQTQVAYGETITVPDDPKLKGHTFAGWDKPIPETMPDSALVFTALFTVNQYTVTFTIPSEEWTKEFTLDYGAAITVPDVPQKPGYTFAGWDKPVPETMPDADLVFTGSYTQNLQGLTLTASGNGMIIYGETSVREAMQNFNVAELSQVILTITPDAGHHIASLLLNGENALSLLTEDGKLTIESMTASVSVSVTFAPNVHDVTFRYGETIYQQTQVAYGETITVPDDPKLKGHTFAGWDKPIPETMPDSALVFTALFTVNQYTVTFTIPSEEWTKEFTLDYGAAITVPDVPQKPGYTFAGWDKPVPETMPDSAIVFTGSYIQNLQGLTLTATGNGMITYGETSVRGTLQNFNVAELSQVILTITPDAGHHIASLLLNGENALSLLTEDGKLTIESMTASVSVSVTFAPNVHDVTFRYGETIYQQTQVAYGETITVPDDPKLKGHTFAGWDKPIPETMPDSALVFTALFTVNQYTVTFTIPSEEWTKEFTLDYGAAITVPDVPQKPGYTFAGWDKPVPETMPDADLVFTGSYTQNSLTLSLTATGNGTVQYGNTSVRSSSQNFDVAELSDVVLTITPDAGHHVETLTINGEDALSQMTDGKLSIGSMTASVIVAVTFAANVIDFADAGVKALCVANWDTNGDGELSYDEAAAVENLGSVFTENQAITSFNELQYFTGLTSIGDNAFNTCSGLTSVTIPENVTRIGLAAFYQCTGLTAIIIPESVTSIGYSSFRNCTNLTAITIPGNVTSIGNWAFSGCSVLTSIKVYEGNTAYDSRDSCNAIIETATNTLITGCQNTVIPNSVTSIGDTAFGKCSGLTSITIPNSVTSIGKWAFYQCTGLTAIIIPESVTSIGYCAFYGCTSLTTITIPSCVTSIGENAFWACKSLTSIKVDEGNSIYDSRDNCNAIIETKSNTLVAGCMNTVIHESVTSIGHGAFGDYTSLTSITIPESVTSIGESAFWGCIGLTNITSRIKEPFAIDNSVFEGVPYETATLFVPAGSVDAYKTTDGWKNFQNIETILQQLTIAVVGDGTVTFSGETLTNTTATFKVGGEVQLILTPEEGCHIERVVVNQQDCTSEVTDGVLTLNITDEDFFVLAEFQHDAVPEPTYVNYTIYIDGLGDVRVKDDILSNGEQTILVPQGSDLVLEFLPDEGQMVDKVTWNGETVTEQVLGNTFVVRNVQEDGNVSVIFMEQIETFEYAGIRYGVTDNTQRIVKVLPYDYSGHLSIPASFEHSQRTWQVQEIGNLAFANCEWLVSVKIPSSISKTGKNLFKRDARLAAIQWDALLPLRTEVTGELTNANMLYYVNDKSYAPQNGNVIVDGMADNIILSDGHDFYCPEAFKAKRVAYNHIYKMLTRRGHCQGWETLVLPFDVETVRLSRNPDNPEIYPYKSLTDDDKVERGETLPFWLYSYGDDDTFTPAASIEANTPYIISMPNDVAYLPMFRLAGSVTFSAHDVDVHCTSDGNLKAPGSQRRFQPSYQRQVMGNDCYLVNVNDSINHQFAEGSKFIQALRPARPFEAYMISQTASVKPWYDIFEQIPTEIRDLPVRDEEQGKERVYDLSGREVSGERTANGRLPKGIYIINGKKQIMK